MKNSFLGKFYLTKTIRLIVLMFVLVLVLLVPIRQPVFAQANTAGPTDPQQFEAFMDGTMAAAMPASHVPGAVVVVVKDGEVFFAKGYGVADVAADIPVDPETTLFRPGSVSKLITWTAVMQLIENGQLSLDEDVNAYLDFVIPNTYAEPITLRHLMTHTAGFEDLGNGLFKLDVNDVVSLEEYVKNNVPARVYEPGTIAAYSNYGTALSGYIVQRLSGMPFEDYLQKNIFEPLSMDHATFQQPLPADVLPNMAGGYGYDRGKYIQGDFEFIVGTPAGALSASGLDMAKFMIAHLQGGAYGGGRILGEATTNQMHSLLYTADERIDGMAYGFFHQVDGGQLVLSHGGDTFLFHSHLRLLPEENLGFFISTNGSSGNIVVETVSEAFMDYYYPQEKAELTPTTDFQQRAADYSGNYILARSNHTSYEKIVFSLFAGVTIAVDPEDDQVLVTLGGQTIRYVETEPGLLVNPENTTDRLVMKEIDGRITIHPNLPFVFLKSPWYFNQAFFGLIFIGGVLLFLVMMMRWLVMFFRGQKAKKKQNFSLRLFRFSAGLFGLTLLAFLIGLMTVFGNINPAYAVPDIFFGEPAWFSGLLTLPIGLAVLAALMVILVVLMWIKTIENVSLRVGYSLLTLFAITIVWALIFWNFLF